MCSCQKLVDLTQVDDVPTDRCTICQKMGGMKNCPLNMHNQNKPASNVKCNAGIPGPFTDGMKCGDLHPNS